MCICVYGIYINVIHVYIYEYIQVFKSCENGKSDSVRLRLYGCTMSSSQLIYHQIITDLWGTFGEPSRNLRGTLGGNLWAGPRGALWASGAHDFMIFNQFS